jgi:3-oxoacyl-[acyl-carrier protein] reductase
MTSPRIPDLVIDGLINNAGGLVRRALVADVNDDFDQTVFDLNARSVVRACRAALPWLKAKGGVIINAVSVAARNGGGGSVFYAASKGFVSTFTHGLAKEVVKRPHPREWGLARPDRHSLSRALHAA